MTATPDDPRREIEAANCAPVAHLDNPLVHIGPLFDMQGSVWNLPMTLPALDANANRIGNITLSTYREVYDFIERNKELALRHFQILYGEVQP